MKWIPVGLLTYVSACQGPKERPVDAPPNIVFILADDLGWRDLGSYGSTFYETPNIDQLAEDGIRFTRAYAANPLCSPTRAALMTGLAPGRLRLTSATGHLDNLVFDPVVANSAPPRERLLIPQSRTQLSTEYTTYAELFQDAGYATAFMGKWHLGGNPYGPSNHGFDKVVGGSKHSDPPGGYFSPWVISTLPRVRKGTHIADVMANEATKFMKKNKHKPFLLNYWLYDVHAPFQGEEHLREKYQKKSDTSGLQSSETMGAMIETMDRGVGTVLKALDDLGLRENTIVVFTSDNGGNEYDVIDSGIFPTNNAPLKGGKAVIYEGGSRVPYIARWPDKFPAGKVTDTLTDSLDIYPTFLSLAGLDIPETVPLDGMDISSALMGEDIMHTPIFNHFPHNVNATGNFAATYVIENNWKLIRFYARNTDLTDKLELYDLSKDPGENNDLSQSNTGKVQHMNGLISDWLIETDSLIPLPNPRSNGITPPDIGKGRLKRMAKEIFVRADIDNNGHMLFKEYQTLSPKRPEIHARPMFNKIDANANNEISLEEFELSIFLQMSHLEIQ